MSLWQALQRVLPSDVLLVGTVVATFADGSCSVQLPSGSSIKVQGESVAVGKKAFVRNGAIVSEAPDLDTLEQAV